MAPPGDGIRASGREGKHGPRPVATSDPFHSFRPAEVPLDELDLPVRALRPDAILPGYAHPGDAGADLRAADDVELPPLGRVVVPTGLAVAVPDGYAAFVHPRSGLASRHGVTVANAPGTIDAGYRGEVMVALVNLDPVNAYRVQRGDRIAQLIVQPVVAARFSFVGDLPASPRAEGGFGSTGR